MDLITNNILLVSGLIILAIISFKITKKIVKYSFVLIIGSFLFFLLAGCSGGNLNVSNKMENVEENTLTRIKDIPFIKGSEINIERSLILGEGKSWSGQLFIKVPTEKTNVFNFYIREIKEFGWKEQTTIRGETSILNFVGDNNRVAIISITQAPFNNSEVLISVSPYTEEFEEKIGDFINEKYLEITEN